MDDIDRTVRTGPYKGAAGGWGSARSLGNILRREGVLLRGAVDLMKQNKADGFSCVSCAWPKPAKANTFEYCENGAKATVWEITTHRTTPDFFAKHTCAELRGWEDYYLEQQGRLTHPMRYDSATDKYLPVSWEAAFAEIGAELKAMQPDATVWYASGRASLETSYMWALTARLFGTNNLPDSSNMCHESTSVGLKESIGSPVGTTTIEDMEETDCIFIFGQNPGTNSPRALHPLADAHKRGVPIITLNPIRERALERFIDPQNPVEMLTLKSTPISSQYHQLRLGGDLAALMGMCKHLIAEDDAARNEGRTAVLDHDFIAEHTHGFETFVEAVRAHDWKTLEHQSGLTRAAMESAAAVYARADKVMAIYGMGVTQHRSGVENVQMIVNLLLLRGNIGKIGAGVCPVRGHSNVQGQRTVGISEKPDLVPLDKLAERYKFEPPRHLGLNTVEVCEAMIAGKIKAFLSLGGNFIRAIPERDMMETAWSKLRLNVQIATKLNRSHIVTAEISYILPCLGRIERDRQATGEQSVAIEDSTACVHGSKGIRPPASSHLLSEPKIVAEIAKSFLPANPNVPWDDWVGDYALVRTEIGVMYPDFENMNTRMWEPGGFHRNLPTRRRVWETPTGKANFTTPKGLDEDPDMPETGPHVLRMMTMRSNDQFNTTIYGYDDRFRGIRGTRMVVLISPDDIATLNLTEGESVGLRTISNDNVTREMTGFRVTAYNIPAGNIGTYYPETNALIPLWHHAERSKVPAAKSIPVKIFKLPPADSTPPTQGRAIGHV
jgi:molybdopterin-dependent oxidoreductase alpha subunit